MSFQKEVTAIMETPYFKPSEMPAILKVSRTTYYKIVKSGQLPYSRLYAGGPRVHLAEHIAAYQARLLANSQPEQPCQPSA